MNFDVTFGTDKKGVDGVRCCSDKFWMTSACWMLCSCDELEKFEMT